MTLEKFLTLSKSVLCLSLATAGLFVIPYILDHQLTSIRNDVKLEIDQTRKETVKLVNTRFDSLQDLTVDLFDKTNKRIGSLETNTFKLAADLRTDTFGLAKDVRLDAFGAISNASNNLLSTVGGVAGNINTQLTTANSSISKVTDAYAAIPSTIGARFDDQTNCKTNSLCWQNMTTDTLVNFRYTGRDISNASKQFTLGFPSLLTNANTITGNFADITTNFKRLTTPKWYDKVLSYGVNGSLIYSRTLAAPAGIPISLLQQFKK